MKSNLQNPSAKRSSVESLSAMQSPSSSAPRRQNSSGISVSSPHPPASGIDRTSPSPRLAAIPASGRNSTDLPDIRRGSSSSSGNSRLGSAGSRLASPPAAAGAVSDVHMGARSFSPTAPISPKPPTSHRSSSAGGAGISMSIAVTPANASTTASASSAPSAAASAAVAAMLANEGGTQEVYRPVSVSAVDSLLEQRCPALMQSVFLVAKAVTAAASSADMESLLSLLQRECCNLVPAASCRVALSAMPLSTALSTQSPSSPTSGNSVSGSGSQSPSASSSAAANAAALAAANPNTELVIRLSSAGANPASAASSTSSSSSSSCSSPPSALQRVTSGRGLIGDAYRQAAVIKLERPVLDPRYCAEVDEDPVLINSIGSPLGSAAHILCVPIQSPSVGLVGVITLVRTHQQQQLFTKQQSQLSSKDSSSNSFAFTDDQAAALYSLGEFVAAALRNGQLLEHTTSAYAASQNAQRRIGGMLDIAKALMSEHRLSTLVSFIIATVPELLDCDRCTLFFVDRRTNELIVTRGASHGRRTSVWQGSSSPGPATLTTSNGKVITLPISATTSPNSSFSAGSSSSSSSTSTNFSAAVTNAINNSASPAQAASTLAVAQQLSHGADDTSEGALPFRKSGEIRLPMDKGIAGYVATTGLSLNIPDAYADERFNPAMDRETGYRTRNILCVPMQDAHGEIIGVIQVLNKSEHAGPFDESDSMILRMFAAQAAIAVKNSRLFADASKALRKSEALLKVTNAISQELELAPLMNIIVTETQQLLSAERCTVFMVDDERDEMWTTASMSHGMGAPLPVNKNVEVITRFPKNRGIAGHVATTGEILNIPDAYQDSRFNQKFDKETGFRTRAMLCVPILHQQQSQQKIMGVMQVLNKKNQGVFTDEDVRLLQAFSAQGAVAISNSRLHHETKRALTHALREQRNLKFMLTFARNLCAELQTSSVAQQLQRQVADLLEADSVHVFMLDPDGDPILYRVTEDEASPARLLASSSSAVLSSPSTPSSTASDDSNGKRGVTFAAGTPAMASPSSSLSFSNLPATQPPNPARQKFNWSKGLVGLVARTGQGMLITERANEAQGFDADCDQRQGRVSHSLLIMPVVFDPERDAANAARKLARAASSAAQRAGAASMAASDSSSSHVQSPSKSQSMALARQSSVSASTTSTTGGATGVLEMQARRAAEVRERDQQAAAAAADPEMVQSMQAAVALPKSAKVICVVLAILDDDQSRSFGSDDERMLRSLCSQAAFSLVKAQQLTKLVEDVSKHEAVKHESRAGDILGGIVVDDLGSDDIEAFQFRMSDIETIKSIGVGSYGEVFAARLKGRQQVVAVKKLSTHGMKSEHVDAFCSEASLMCQLRHPNVVQFIGAVAEPPDLCIITEYCARGSLCDLLLDDTVKLDFAQKLKICMDAAAGMAYMHGSNPVILHRDLKSDNLLVTSDWQVKVADFGLSRYRSQKKTMTQVGTPMWMAPEVILGEKYTEKADVYSFGIILWEIMTRREPYEDKEAMQIVVQVVNDGLRPTIPAEFMDCPLVPLMRDCWEEDPNKRPVFQIVSERLANLEKQYRDTAFWA